MTPKQFEKAKPIIRRLEATNLAIKDMDSIAPEDTSESFKEGENPFSSNFMNDFDPNDGHRSPFSAVFCEHSDGSGFHVNMTGANVAREVWQAIHGVLTEKKQVYLRMLEEIE